MSMTFVFFVHAYNSPGADYSILSSDKKRQGEQHKVVFDIERKQGDNIRQSSQFQTTFKTKYRALRSQEKDLRQIEVVSPRGKGRYPQSQRISQQPKGFYFIVNILLFCFNFGLEILCFASGLVLELKLPIWFHGIPICLEL